jgi:DNA polymerase/3'-5' exonuclease PolX
MNNKYGQDKKDLIIKELETMSNKELVAKNFFKVRAYNKVIDQLKSLKTISSMEDLKNVQGIGVKIKAKIEEILKTGKLKAAERARNIKDIKIYEELLKIHGIGVSKAEELIKIYNIKGIDELYIELEKNPNILNEKQKNGLKYYYDIQKRIPKNEIDKHLKKIKTIIKGIDKDLLIKGVGSYKSI